jgi:hypothetical protein
MTTYEKSRTILSSPILEDIPGRLVVAHGGSFAENTWGLEGTMRHDYAHHEPMAMFPEPSSTVPNATLTQQRLLAQVKGPVFLGIESEADTTANPTPYEPQNSIPWSEYLKTQASSDERDASNLKTDADTHPLMPPAPETTDNLSQTSQRSQCSRRGSRVQLDGSLICDEVEPDQVIAVHPSSSNVTRPEPCEKARPTSSRSDQREAGYMDAVEEQSTMDYAAAQVKPYRDASPAKTKTKRNLSPQPASDDYLASLGLGQEQYKPRPSRSRSTKLDKEEPVDYSVRPESLAKRKSRRTKTTGDDEETNESAPFTPRKIQQICDMGFTPSTTQRALKNHNGNVHQTLDWLITNGPLGERDELAPPELLQRKHKTKKNIAQNQASHQDIKPVQEVVPQSVDISMENATALDGDQSIAAKALIVNIERPPISPISPKVQVMIPKKVSSPSERRDQQPLPNVTSTIDSTGVSSSRKPKRRKTTHDQPEPSLEEIQTTTPALAKEKKKGRGRPRKEPAIAASSTQAIPEVTSTNTEDGEGKNQSDKRVAALKIQPQAVPLIEAPESKESEEQTKDQPTVTIEPPTSPPPLKPAKAPEKPKKPETTPQSLASKGKYRVGLSKRSRVAPLLKIVKK